MLAIWLQKHLGVEIIVRDRAEAYAEGATRGAPQAQQVADRFRLIQNASRNAENGAPGDRRISARVDPHASSSQRPSRVDAARERGGEEGRNASRRAA